MGSRCTECTQVFRTPNLPTCGLCKREVCSNCMPNHKCHLLNYKAVFLVRKDLKMSPGKIGAQVAHAAVDLVLSDNCDTSITDDWRAEGARKVVLAVDNVDELEVYESLAKKAGLNVAKVVDFGLTEVPRNSVTVLGIGPDTSENIDAVTGKLPAYKQVDDAEKARILRELDELDIYITVGSMQDIKDVVNGETS